ncbi:flavin reductase [Mesorhizobium sp. L-8-10]|uniref:flavin reductase family protein n=1 Tax=Mesorhizobium sp. L-8-10 TaxID=2744523 RepID=UPI0019357F0C|nr:flavin reductase family protein [Mesorhizobium sp. L-8-10]BCH31588.1 flavin reductase [Mesorhizobium sp. L-8-10]
MSERLMLRDLSTSEGAAAFRAAMRLLVGNVSVITAGAGRDRSGLVVISMVSLSADPPKVIACVNRSSSTWPLIERFGHFGVSSLGPQHQQVAERFSGFGGIKGADRYEGADWITLATGASLLEDAVAVFDCRLDEMIDRGSHSIVIGSVAAVGTRDSGGALTYWRGGYRALAA